MVKFYLEMYLGIVNAGVVRARNSCFTGTHLDKFPVAMDEVIGLIAFLKFKLPEPVNHFIAILQETSHYKIKVYSAIGIHIQIAIKAGDTVKFFIGADPAIRPDVD